MEIKRMPNITLTIDEFFDMEDQEFAHGGEAVIFRTEKPNTLYKFFKDHNRNYIDMSENKFKKILELYKLNLESAVRPLSTISVNGHLVGYEMTYNPDSVTLKNSGFDRQQKIAVLKRTKEILEYFRTQDITYGDVKSNNILIDRKTGNIEFCDMDNIRIGENPIDITDYELDFYLKNGGLEEHIDAYMHSLMTLEALQLCLDDINENPKTFSQHFQKKSIPIIKTLINPQDYRGEYISQYIKKRRG